MENMELMNVNGNMPGEAMAMFSSFNSDSREDKVKLYNALTNPDRRIADYINTTIGIKDVVMVPVDMVQTIDKEGNPFEDEAPKTRKMMRTIILADDGYSYGATSDGISNSLRMLYQVFGTLHFDEPVKMQVKQVKARRGNVLNLVMV